MNPLNHKLRQTFYFNSRDLLANRGGGLSERQQARQSAAGAGLKVGIAFFVIVMLGTLGLIFFFSSVTGANEGASRTDTLVGGGVAVGVILLVLVVSLLSSRKYMAATLSKQVKMAEGQAVQGKVRADSAHFELKLGRTKLRLLTQEHLEAFQMGESYRIYYLPGPAPVILSGEVIGTETEAESTLEPETPLEDDPILRRQRNARPVVIVLAALTLGIPLAGFAATSLPGPLRILSMLVLLGVGVGFVSWALRRMS